MMCAQILVPTTAIKTHSHTHTYVVCREAHLHIKVSNSCWAKGDLVVFASSSTGQNDSHSVHTMTIRVSILSLSISLTHTYTHIQTHILTHTPLYKINHSGAGLMSM